MDETQILCVRSFNRAVTQQIGALSDDYLQRGRPLGEARLLFEIGPAGGDVRSLRAKLGLDPGYMSRLLRALEQQALIVTSASESDGRVRRAELTAKGRKEYRAYDESSDGLAQALLAPLSAAQRDRLVAAMSEIERLIRASAIAIGAEDVAGPLAQHCLRRYFEELARRFVMGYDPAQGLRAGADELNPPNGVFLIARLDGTAVGCVGLKRMSKRVAELKRMWVDPSVRGLGLGRRLLEAAEARAKEQGATRIRLDTNKTLVEAARLYVDAGYREIPDYNGEPYADRWFEKRLGR